MEGEGLVVINQSLTHAKDDEDELQPLAPRQIVHFSHCISCHVENCDMERIVKCSVLRCPQCAARMHECKIEDHLNEICPKAIVPCINASFGCERMVRRDKRSRHLERCCASVVVCGREWARYALSPMSKLQLKNWGKNIEAEPVRNFRNLPLDIALTFSDQDVIVKSYGFSRVDRVRRRDGLHPSHPVLPLRDGKKMKRLMGQPNKCFSNGATERLTNCTIKCSYLLPCSCSADSKKQEDQRSKIRNYDGTLVGASVFKDDENSSDEERRMKEAKLKKKRAMFANCYMCQIDPSSQHLHTLGNESSKYDQIRKVKKREKDIDEFHKMYDLQINISPETMPEFLVRGENIAFIRAGGSLYTRRCLKTFRRTEYADHHLSQHVRSIDSLSDLVVRCPNWMRGCLFYTKRLTPRSGTIRSLREAIFACAKERSMVSLVWEKCDGCWFESGISIDFSVAEGPPQFDWEPAKELSDHLAHCLHSDVFEYTESRVPVLAANLQQITNEFMIKLPHFI